MQLLLYLKTELTVAVVKRYCIDDAVINYGYVELSQQDVVRQFLYNYILNNAGVKSIVNSIYTYKRIGRDAICLHEELAYLQALVELFMIIKEETVCSNINLFDELKETYKLDCIREALSCRYGKGNLIEEFIDELGLNGAYNGIGYMTIQGATSDPDCSPFQPTQPN